MLKHMEQDLLTERTKNQRKSSKLNEDDRKTYDEASPVLLIYRSNIALFVVYVHIERGFLVECTC